ncbi:MAG: hypothetical protein RBT47_04955, partial [Anaerolineae bacterium]|nr:hypothetical protein [Anaerolineae bacterium]
MEISDILCEIAQLLEVCGYPDPIKAVRLKQWADDLRVSNSSQQRVEILTKVKNVIAGMNSLSDIYLVPATRSEFSTNKANRKLY